MSRERGKLRNMLQSLFGTEPETVYGQINIASQMHRKILERELFSQFQIENMPEKWSHGYFLRNLFLNGYICITDTTLGVLALQTGIAGYNVFGEPTECVIGNPVLGSIRRTIDDDCVLVKIFPDYGNFCSILDYYSFMLANCDSSIAVNTMNCKATNICECSDKATAESYKKAMDEIYSGKPGVFVKSGMASNITQSKIKENFVGKELLEVQKSIKNEWLTLIGVKSVNTLKRERLVTAEAESSSDMDNANVDIIRSNITEGLDKANSMFNLDLKLKEKEGEKNGDDESVLNDGME